MTKRAKKKTTKINRSTKGKSSTIARDSKQGTKSSTVLSLLESTKGATISELSEATGWQSHSVRGFLSGTVKKKFGRNIAHEIVDGERRYWIAS